MKLTLLALLTLTATPALADWQQTLDAAKGQTVYWNAWGGDERTNAFITWVGEQTEAKYGVKVEQVKLTDTAEAVTRVVSEKAAGHDQDGSVDMIWINGPNFLAMKEQGLLHGPFVADLPNAQYLDLSPTSAASVDFTDAGRWHGKPVAAGEVRLHLRQRPRDRSAENHGRFPGLGRRPSRPLHPPDPTDFMGATFLKQALIELTPDPAVLQQPATDANFAAATAPLWAWYDALRPNLWHQGDTFPANQSVQQQLLNDGEVDMSMSFDPASTAAAIAQGLLPDTARVFVPAGGSIGNICLRRHPLQRRPCRRGGGGRELPAQPRHPSPYAEYRGARLFLRP